MKWQPIEAAPEGDLMLVAVPIRSGWYIAVARFGDGGELEDQDGESLGYDNADMTHWMPLPEAPEE